MTSDNRAATPSAAGIAYSFPQDPPKDRGNTYRKLRQNPDAEGGLHRCSSNPKSQASAVSAVEDITAIPCGRNVRPRRAQLQAGLVADFAGSLHVSALSNERKWPSVLHSISLVVRICKLCAGASSSCVCVANTKGQHMKYMIAVLGLIAGFIVTSTVEASAVVCARGVYRAGCVAPRRAVGYRSTTVVRPGVVVRRGAVVRRR